MRPAKKSAHNGLNVFIVAGEESGDLHASNLIRCMAEIRPEVRFEGFGGDRMAAAGCELHANILHLAAMGLTFLQNITAFLGLIRKFYRRISSERPDALVLVDFPGFNFILARIARLKGIPVVYYICPQIWAWAPWRRKKILRLTDLLMVIFPFEESYYRGHGNNVVYVGHPLADALEDKPPAEELAVQLRERFEVDKDVRLIGLFPGSRVHEVQQLLPFFRKTLEKMELERDCYRLMVSCCRDKFRPLIESAFASSEMSVDIVEGDAHPLMAACDLALVASGTATLELAYYEKPMLVLYRINRLPHLGYRLIRTSPFISLVNILGGEEIVPEEITYRDTSAVQAKQAKALLDDTHERKRCLERLGELKTEVFKPGGIRRAAETLSRFLNESRYNEY